MTLGDYIAKYRADHDNMSLRSFSKLTGLSVTYISNIEKGINNDGNQLFPTIATYRRIAESTGVTLTELLSSVDDSVTINSPLSDREHQLLDNFRAAPEIIRKAAFDMLASAAQDAKKNLPADTTSAAG